MPGGRGQGGFGRRRGMITGRGQNATMGRDLFGWMKSWVQTQHKADRSVSNQSPIENLHPSDELTQLKHRAESVQSQLEEINRRIREIEQNPRSLFARIDDTLCTGCGRCASICPRRAITPKNNTMQIDQSKCTGCGICVSECPVGAINLIV